jgi:hypothetical protein
MTDAAADRLLSGAAWADFCATLAHAGTLVDRFGTDAAPLDRAEYYRFLARLTRNGLERFVENCEPERPRLRDAPWRQSINFQSPDQDHLLAEFIDGSHSYRITGNRGTAPYFVMASWTAPIPRHPGAASWAEQGVAGLQGFDPTALGTTHFLPSDGIPFDADGNFEVIVSQHRPEGCAAWLGIHPDCVGLLVRTLHHRREAEIAPVLRIERLDAPAPRPVTPGEVADNLAKAGQTVIGYAELVRRWWQDNLGKERNRISFSRALYLSNGGVPDRHHGFGTWECAPGEALVIDFTAPDCDYWIFQLCNIWQENLDNYEDGGGHLTKFRARSEADGRIRIIVADTEPALPGNWIKPFGHRHGGMSLRFIKPEGDPPPVEIRRVAIDLLRSNRFESIPPMISGDIAD